MSKHDDKLAAFRKYGHLLSTMSGSTGGPNINDKRWKNLTKSFAPGAVRETAIGLIDTTVMSSGKNGYLFTDEKVYYLETLEKPKKLWYDEIASIRVIDSGKPNDESHVLEIMMKDGSVVRWTSTFLNKTPLCSFFNELLKIGSKYAPDESVIEYQMRTRNSAEEAGGLGFGAYKNVQRQYGEEKFHARQGHGYAAERANHMYDKVTGHDAKIAGDDNAKNGPDRIVDGVYIQSKYCATGARCVNESFADNGKGTFRYMRDGKPMQIEVPSDKYDAAVEAMKTKIENGQMPGVTDPNDASKYVRKGHFKYAQARAIAKAGTVESLVYDAATGSVIATSAFGVSAVITFATCVWNGENIKVSLKEATLSGIKVGGTAFVTSIVSSQLSKAGLNSMMVEGSEAVVRVLGKRAYKLLANAFRPGAKAIGGNAALKSAAKILRNNVITSGVTIVVLSTADVANIFRGRISGKQLFRNIANTTGTVAGGSVGWMAGAAAGSVVVPGAGSVVGGIIGSVVGGGALGKATDAATSLLGEDDVEKMVAIIQSEFEAIAEEYMLNANEAEKCVDVLGEKLNAKKLKDMFASKDRNAFARGIITPIVDDRVSKREKIMLPSADSFMESLSDILNEIADAEECELVED